MTKIRTAIADRLDRAATKLRPAPSAAASERTTAADRISSLDKKFYDEGFNDANVGLPILTPASGAYINGYRAGHVNRKRRLHEVL